MGECCYCSLITSDAYVKGIQVLLASIKDAKSEVPTTILYTPSTLSPSSIEILSRPGLADHLIPVNPILSKATDNLDLLGRPELAATLTKLHVFNQTQFAKIVYLDADTLLLQNIDNLFDTDAYFAAAPDSGWPDCFNSGVFVCTPNRETFDTLCGLADSGVSFDGGDQGLLNYHFANWHRLPFTYNVAPTATYSYVPAYRAFRHQISIVHFIGKSKPWDFLAYADGTIKDIPDMNNDYKELLETWWKVWARHFGQKPLELAMPKYDMAIKSLFKVEEYSMITSYVEETRFNEISRPSLESAEFNMSSTQLQPGFDLPNINQQTLETTVKTDFQTFTNFNDGTDGQHSFTSQQPQLKDNYVNREPFQGIQNTQGAPNHDQHVPSTPSKDVSSHTITIPSPKKEPAPLPFPSEAWDATKESPPSAKSPGARMSLIRNIPGPDDVKPNAWDLPFDLQPGIFVSEYTRKSGIQGPTRTQSIENTNTVTDIPIAAEIVSTRKTTRSVSGSLSLLPWESGISMPTRRFPEEELAAVRKKMEEEQKNREKNSFANTATLEEIIGEDRKKTKVKIETETESIDDEKSKAAVFRGAEGWRNAWDVLPDINQYASKMANVLSSTRRKKELSSNMEEHGTLIPVQNRQKQTIQQQKPTPHVSTEEPPQTPPQISNSTKVSKSTPKKDTLGRYSWTKGDAAKTDTWDPSKQLNVLREGTKSFVLGKADIQREKN